MANLNERDRSEYTCMILVEIRMWFQLQINIIMSINLKTLG